MINEAYKYSDLTSKIIGCAITVHKTLGNGFQEIIYQRALGIEFDIAGINFQREFEMPIYYRDQKIGTRRVDFLVEEVVSVELKAITKLEDVSSFLPMKAFHNFNLDIENDFVAYSCGQLSELIENDSTSFSFFIIPEADYYEIPLEWEFISKGGYKDSGELVLDIFPDFVESFEEINTKEQLPDDKVSYYWSEEDDESQDEI